jgi:putative ABC transport system ATP-binding protein
MKTVLRAENLKKRYNRNEEVLRGVSLEFAENSLSVILGHSGSGKSTLLNIMSGLLKPTEGRVFLDDTEITAITDRELSAIKRKHIGYVFQNYLLLSNLTAEENIRIGAPDNDTALNIDRLAEILDIKGVLKKFPSQLSGGEQQRVAIARAVIKKPKFLFCDEATGALDESNSKKVIELIHTAKKSFGIAVIFVTHNLSIAETADRIITMKDGLSVSDEMNANPIPAANMVW